MSRHAGRFYGGLLAIGLLVLSLGFSLWVQVSLGVSRNYEALRGTLQLGWLPSNETYPTQTFKIQIDLTSNRVWLEYGFTYWKSGLYVVQILLPFTLQRDLVGSRSGQAWSFVNVHPYGSIVRVEYQGENPGEGYGFGYLTSLFLLNQTLFYANRGTYSILLPIGADVQPAITDKMAELASFVGIMGGGAATNTVEVVVPFSSILVQATPSDVVIEVPSNRTLLIFKWNLGHSLRTIALTYSMPGEAATFADLSFESGAEKSVHQMAGFRCLILEWVVVRTNTPTPQLDAPRYPMRASL